MDTKTLEAQLTDLLRTVDEGFSADRCARTLEAIFTSDRRGDYRAFRETAQLVQRELVDAGLSDVQIIPHPADGVRKHGDWIVPQAWDVLGGELAITAPSPAARTVVRHPDEPLCIAMYSAPTSANGIEAELVLWEDVADDEDLSGKMVLTSERARGVAMQALPRGAAGIVSDYAHPHAVMRDARYWENYCFVPRNQDGGFAFILSPNEGDRLRRDLRLARGKGECLTVRAVVDTRLYDGEVDIVTGVVPGDDGGEEVLLVAHLYEIGANDNCSGAALCTEVARCLTGLVANGQLARPRRSIRVLLCFEQYGTIAFLDLNRDRVRHIVAGLNADMVGEDQGLCGSVLTLDRTPPANPSFTNDLIAQLLDIRTRTFPEFRWRETCYGVHDGFISDPMIDIPTPTLLHQPDRFYHSDADTPDKVSQQTLRIVGGAVAAYAYYIADADAAEAELLARLAHARGRNRLSAQTDEMLQTAKEVAANRGAADAAEGCWRRLAFLREQEERAMRSVLRLVPDEGREQVLLALRELERDLERGQDDASEEIAGSLGVPGMPARAEPRTPTPEEDLARSMVPKRLVFGSLTMADLPPDAAAEFAGITSERFPYSTHLCSALFWADGERTLLEIRDLLAQERGDEDLGFLIRFFEFLETHGYCRIGRGGCRGMC